jgi:hypothetical protein
MEWTLENVTKTINILVKWKTNILILGFWLINEQNEILLE